MAIIQLGELVTGIRGKTGGLVYSANRSGAYTKHWTKGSNPRSQAQQAQRASFASMGAAWQALTPTQRAAWDSLATTDPEPIVNSLGETIAATGWQYFNRANNRRRTYGLAPLADAPTGTEATAPGYIPTPELVIDVNPVNTATLTWDSSGAAADCVVVMYAGVSLSAARAANFNTYRFIGFADPYAGEADLSTPLFAALGQLQAGWRVDMQVYQRRLTGLQSVMNPCFAVVT